MTHYQVVTSYEGLDDPFICYQSHNSTLFYSSCTENTNFYSPPYLFFFFFANYFRNTSSV